MFDIMFFFLCTSDSHLEKLGFFSFPSPFKVLWNLQVKCHNFISDDLRYECSF